MATCLSNVLPFGLGFAGNRLPIGNLRSPHIRLYLKLAEHTIHDNLQVQLTHTTDNGLPGLRVGAQLEGWIFFRQFVQSYRHLILVGTGLRLDGNVNDGSREVNGFQNNRFLWIA